MPNRANMAATFMQAICEDPRFGYSQGPERFGTESLGTLWVDCEGESHGFWCGARDCSSAVIDCWREALASSSHAGCLDAATYTGNMVDVFTASGLFEWHGMDFIAQRGDIYLNIQSHTAMCITSEPDVLGEFSLNECGDIVGGEPGDQTGCESSVHGYYDFPWDGILHYNGGADGEGGGDQPCPQPTPAPTPVSGEPVYAAMVNGCWLPEMHGSNDSSNSGDNFAGNLGCPIQYIAIDCPQYRVYTEANGWLPWVDHYDPNDLENGCAGDGSNILRIEIPDESYHYAAHTFNNGWLSTMCGCQDTGGSCDTFAGDDSPIDGITITR